MRFTVLTVLSLSALVSCQGAFGDNASSGTDTYFASLATSQSSAYYSAASQLTSLSSVVSASVASLSSRLSTASPSASASISSKIASITAAASSSISSLSSVTNHNQAMKTQAPGELAYAMVAGAAVAVAGML